MNNRAIIAGAAGGAVAIAIMELLSARTMTPLVTIPFATSIVLVKGSPEAVPAQPRALVGGHLVSAVIGLAMLKLAGPSLWVATSAVGLAMVAMHLTGTFHPPAGINPLLVVVNNMSWGYLAVPVASGALLLLAFSFFWHKFITRDTWPDRWW